MAMFGEADADEAAGRKLCRPSDQPHRPRAETILLVSDALSEAAIG